MILGKLGAGGMGTVLRAYDPKLHREVALKLMLPDRVARPELAARLVREAQAMARLSHPNVVPVYDVELDGQRIAVAMELVEGETLKEFCQRPRTVREVLEVFLAAGRGLAAAHVAGLVHRDFKPGNVLIGNDGRARVTDFGLAKAFGNPMSSETEALHDDETPSPTDAIVSQLDELTADGSIVGTPAYMAPEQHARQQADPRSDQYAFCIALWEALFGKRPFTSTSIEALRLEKRRGPPTTPARRGVPKRIRRALARGLSNAAEERRPNMDALLTRLEPPRARRSLLVGGAAAGVAVAAIWAIGQQDTPCQSGREEIAETWNPAAVQRLRGAVLGAGSPLSESTAARLTERIDGYVAAWTTAHEDACRATVVHGTQSQRVLDLRMACLDRAQRALAATLGVLEKADAQAVEHAADVVGALPQVESCADIDTLQRVAPLPNDPDQRAQVQLIGEALARGSALRRTGKLEASEAVLREATADADRLDYGPSRGRALVELGTTLLVKGDTTAEGLLTEGLQLALTSADMNTAIRSAYRLAIIVADEPGRSGESMILARTALGLAESVEPSGRLAAVAHGGVAEAARATGDRDLSETHYRRALANHRRPRHRGSRSASRRGRDRHRVRLPAALGRPLRRGARAAGTRAASQPAPSTDPSIRTRSPSSTTWPTCSPIRICTRRRRRSCRQPSPHPTSSSARHTRRP